MKKIYIIIAVIALALLLVGFLMLAVNKKVSTQTTTSTTSFPISGTATTATTSGTGNSSSNRNFLQDADTVPDPVNKGYYYLGNYTYGGQKSVPYEIEYIDSTNYFNVTLLQEPLGQVRKDAGADLMRRLGITQSQMCDLNYTVSTPDFVNSYYSGVSLGFDFCPGAVKLP